MIPEVAHTGDFQRIFDLPRRHWSAGDLASLAAELTEILRTPGGSMRLRPVQALALHDAGIYGGLFGPIGVGEGKTLITLLLPLVLGARRPLLLLPAALIEKTQRDRLALSRHWRIPNTLRCFSYDMLGRVQAASELETYQPDVVICDEVHRLKNRRAAVTRRVARYMMAQPFTKFCGLSGTVMSKSIKDFAHILRWCLKTEAPIPLTNEETEEWAEALDQSVDPCLRRSPGALLEFCAEGENEREGFRRRLTETPGVVATIGEGESVGASIYVRSIQQKVTSVTEGHFKKLREEWCTPDGWEISQATDLWRYSQELALGFHYVRVDREKYRAWLQTLNTCGDGVPLTQENRQNTLGDTTPNTQVGKPKTSGDTGPKTEVRRGLVHEQPMRDPRRTSEGGAKETVSVLERLGIRPNTVSQPNSATPSMRASTGHAPSAEIERSSEKGPAGSASTTITRPKEFGVCSAISATQGLGTSETLSVVYRQQFPIFLETARPPRAWLDARSTWAKFVREALSRSRSLDSELQVANACDAGKLPPDALRAWREVKDTFASMTVPVWHDDSALQACVDWMREPGIVWVDHVFFGRCLSKVSGAAYYAEGGFSDDGQYLEAADPRKSAVVSLSANREGKNLQKIWHRNLFVCPPASAEWWEQAIARTHRTGQEADEVTLDVLLGCRENFDNCIKAIEGARAIFETTGKKQKLLMADILLPSEAEIDALRTPRWVK